MPISITLIGGPTALIEIDGFRLLTDPTFDAPGEHRLPHVTLTKTSGPALGADAVGPIDAVLLSHDRMPTTSTPPVAPSWRAHRACSPRWRARSGWAATRRVSIRGSRRR